MCFAVQANEAAVELAPRPFVAAGVALTAAGPIALIPITAPAPTVHVAAPPISAQAVWLTDEWSLFITDVTLDLGDVVQLASGTFRPHRFRRGSTRSFRFCSSSSSTRSDT